jgi:hypothetical protein
MERFFIVSETFGYETLCFCKTGEHRHQFTFNKDDIIEFKGGCQYSESHGLFYLVFVNNMYHFYMSVEEIDQYFLMGRFVSADDLKNNIIQIKNYIDYSLDVGDKDLFMHYSEKLIETNTMLSNFENTFLMN